MRPKIATIDFDFGMTYFAYPGERLPARLTASIIGRRLSAAIEASATARSASPAATPIHPNVSNTGAWSQYVAAGVGFDGPSWAAAAEPWPYHSRLLLAFLVRQSGFTTRWLPIACLSQLADGRDLHATRPSTSICATTTPICRKRTALSLQAIQMRGRAAALQSRYQPGWTSLELVRCDVRCQGLVCV